MLKENSIETQLFLSKIKQSIKYLACMELYTYQDGSVPPASPWPLLKV